MAAASRNLRQAEMSQRGAVIFFYTSHQIVLRKLGRTAWLELPLVQRVQITDVPEHITGMRQWVGDKCNGLITALVNEVRHHFFGTAIVVVDDVVGVLSRQLIIHNNAIYRFIDDPVARMSNDPKFAD